LYIFLLIMHSCARPSKGHPKGGAMLGPGSGVTRTRLGGSLQALQPNTAV